MLDLQAGWEEKGGALSAVIDAVRNTSITVGGGEGEGEGEDESEGDGDGFTPVVCVSCSRHDLSPEEHRAAHR